MWCAIWSFLHSEAFQNIILVVSAVGAAGLFQVTRGVAKRTEMFRLLCQMQSDKEIGELFSDFTSLIRKYSPQELGDFVGDPAASLTESERDQYLANQRLIYSVLNWYELIAIGIDQHAYDGKVFKKWWRTTFVVQIIKTKLFIIHARNGTKQKNALYENATRLAKKWASQDEKNELEDLR